ncbi:MAG: DNA adenine methylase [Faecalibacterium sp.]|jgi:adenine-specific DNA-methyltransferase|nr:DNA adenine methylase [Faecalibacterium sp.]
MRYIGNKESMVEEIDSFIESRVESEESLTLFDAFCGTGAVSDRLKNKFNLVINDNLKWATVYTAGRLYASSCHFERLGFDPFAFLNQSDEKVQGFIYKNYAPTESSRMYFTPENAARIDYFRKQIEEWHKNKLLSEAEYMLLLASLVESVSRVSNTAGVYGAFLKKWDGRALKPIEFIKPAYNACDSLNIKIYNDKTENIISDVKCDILYLDPPYTQNQYGTQYHLLETLILNDHPSVSKVTGSRPVMPMRSDWSKEYKAHILLDRIIANTTARYIVMSYNNDGLMSKEYIEAVMKRYGKPETYCCKKISYKKYQNWKSQNHKEHFEYLFFVEKKDPADVVYESPLNYIGSKARVIPAIRENLPSDIDDFIDAFGGGFNVGINIRSESVVYNEYNHFVKELIESFWQYDTFSYIVYMKKMIRRFELEPGRKDAYLNVRDYYNSLPEDKRDPRLLLVVILYSFQQQIRFNSNHGFNNPVGMRWFNDNLLEKLVSFSRRIKELNVCFSCADYTDTFRYVDDGHTFVYLDPPYMLTNGSYNDGKRGFKGWDVSQEAALFEFLDKLNHEGSRFMLSYVLEHKGKVNQNLVNWTQDNHYHIIELGDILGISGSRRKEILVTNYER